MANKDMRDWVPKIEKVGDMVALDFKSQFATNNVAKMRMFDPIGEYGEDTVDEVDRQLIEQSENLLRRRLLELPNGTLRARQYRPWVMPGKEMGDK